MDIEDLPELIARGDPRDVVEEHFDGDFEAFLSHLNNTINTLLRTDLTRAQSLAEAVGASIDSFPGEYRPRFWSILARIALWSGQYREASRIYHRALKQFLKNRNWEAAARLRRGLVEVHMYLGEYEQALAQGRKARQFFQRKGLDDDVARVLTNMGNVYHRMDRNRDALRCYDRAGEIFAARGGVPSAIVDYNRANIYANMNQLETAEELYQQAADVYSSAGMELAETQAVYSMAYLAFLDTRYAEAMRLFERVSESFDRLGDTKSSLITLLDIAEIDLQLNQYGSAIMLGETIIPQFHEMGMMYEEGKALYFVATAKLELGDARHCSRLLTRANKLFEREGNNLWLGMVALARTRLQMATRRYTDAAETARTARRLFEKSKDIRRGIDARIIELDALYRSGSTTKAARLQTSLRSDNLARYQRYSLAATVGEHHYRRNEMNRAYTSFREATRIIEQMLSGLEHDEIRFFFAADKYHAYARVVECLLALGRTRDSMLANLTALSLLNRRVVSQASLEAEVPAGVVNRIRELRSRLHRMYNSPPTGERSVTGSEGHVALERRLWIEERKARTYLSSAPVIADQRAGTNELPNASLDTDTSMVTYFVSDRTVGAFVSTATETEFVRFDCSSEDIRVSLRKLHFLFESTVAQWRRGNDRTDMAQHYLADLHALLFAPVQRYVSGRKLLIVADGELSQVPFETLWSPTDGYLKDRYDIRLVVCPEDVLVGGMQGTVSAGAKSAVLSVPSPSLPHVINEARAIGALYPGATVLSGDSATRQALTEHLQNSDGFVHIAAHAARSSENPLFSRILMSDGPYFPFDLFGTGVQAQLVTLSGCQTAAPGLHYGNSLSLAKSFYKAGARYVLASLWPVVDEAAMLFMTEFYHRLHRSGNVVESYHQALDELEKALRNPAFWGGFVLLGT